MLCVCPVVSVVRSEFVQGSNTHNCNRPQSKSQVNSTQFVLNFLQEYTGEVVRPDFVFLFVRFVAVAESADERYVSFAFHGANVNLPKTQNEHLRFHSVRLSQSSMLRHFGSEKSSKTRIRSAVERAGECLLPLSVQTNLKAYKSLVSQRISFSSFLILSWRPRDHRTENILVVFLSRQ